MSTVRRVGAQPCARSEWSLRFGPILCVEKLGRRRRYLFNDPPLIPEPRLLSIPCNRPYWQA